MHCQASPNVENYLERLERHIRKKKLRLIKNALIQGKLAARDDLHPISLQLHTIIKKISEAKIDCTIKYAQSQLDYQLEKNPHVIVNMTQKLLKNIAAHTDIDITAHHCDIQVIKSSLHEISKGSASARKIVFIEDDNCKRGSLIIKANKSILDANTTTQLNKAKELLKEEFEL